LRPIIKLRSKTVIMPSGRMNRRKHHDY